MQLVDLFENIINTQRSLLIVMEMLVDFNFSFSCLANLLIKKKDSKIKNLRMKGKQLFDAIVERTGNFTEQGYNY